MSESRKKPQPDIFLLALERINVSLDDGERRVEPAECLVFEDSVAGVKAGRRAGMRVCWVPHEGLREVHRGREEMVLGGRSGEGNVEEELSRNSGGEQREEKSERDQLWSGDGRAEMLMSLDEFDYELYGIRLKNTPAS